MNRGTALRNEVNSRSEWLSPSCRRKGHLTLLSGGKDCAEPDEWTLEALTTELWEALFASKDDRRNAALGELAEREDPHLAPVVIVNLAKNDLPTRWRDALIRATPRIQVTDDSLRFTLANSLLRYASVLKNATNSAEESVLWTAIRRYATLRPQADIGKLVEFLADPDQPLPRRHVILLAIQNAFYAWAPTETESASLDELRARVSLLARRYLVQSWTDGEDENAVTLASYCAAMALGCADLDELTNLVISRGERWLLRLALQDSSPMLQRWRIRTDGSGSGSVPDSVEQALAKLTSSHEAHVGQMMRGNHAGP